MPANLTRSEYKEALQIAKKNGDTEAFIIGGGQIYKLSHLLMICVGTRSSLAPNFSFVSRVDHLGTLSIF